MRSKFFNLVLVLFFAFLLVGCHQQKNNYEELLNDYLDLITVEEKVKEDFTLLYQVNDKNDHVITWESSNNEVLSIVFNESNLLYEVTVIRQEVDTEVILTSTLTLNSGLSKNKVFTLVVEAKEKEEQPDPEKPLKEQYNCISIAEAIEIANASGDNGSAESYYVYGTIVKVSNPTYGEMTITDGVDSIYVYGVIDENNKFYGDFEDKPVAGDEVVLYGQLKTFKNEPEMGRSVLKGFNHIKQEVDSSEYVLKTVAEARSASEGDKLQLEGVVAFVTYAFGFNPNGFYLVDNTGSIYVYGSDVAQQVKVGNKVKIAAEKTYYVNPDESYNAEKYGYQGACQVQKPVLLENDKGNNDFNKDWVQESTVKQILDTELSNNITSDIFKVTAIINKVPGSGFVNYYINDLDQNTGSYVYTACNGSDFEWLDEFDNQICTVYLSAINCKSTSSGCIYRFIPVKVEKIDNFVFDTEKICEFALNYYIFDQFNDTYTGDPELEVITSVSNSFLKFEDVKISYTSSDENIISFDNNIMHVNAAGKATITMVASYESYTFTLEKEIDVIITEVNDFMTIKEAFDTEDGTVVKVKGVIVSSLVNKTGFYLGDETGVLAVTCSEDTLTEVELGQMIIVEGTRKHNKKDPASKLAGQSYIADATIVTNYYGDNEYSKASFITDKTLKDIYELDYTEDHTMEVYVVKAKINVVETQWYTNIELVSEDGKTTLGLYCSSAKQYNWLKEFAGEVITVEIAPCNWNDKDFYRGCVISATNSEKTVINNLNFENN